MNTRAVHPRRATLVLPVLMLTWVSASGCDIAMSDFRQKETAEWRKTYTLQPGGSIEVINVNGKIDVESAPSNTVEVVAEKSARASSADAAREALARIEIRDTASPTSVRIETKLQRGSGGFFGGSNQEVQYVLKVPASVDVHVSTVNGGIVLTGLTGRVTAEATNGGVKARDVSGALDARTTNGGVEVDVARLSDSGVKLACTNGGISLRLPSDSRATVSARITNGGISTSGLNIESSGEVSRRHLEGRLNGGGPRVDLEGTNGGIRIASR